MHHIRASREMVGRRRRERSKIYIQRRTNLGRHGVPMLSGLGRGRGLYWWARPGKMCVGAGLWSYGNALSTAAIWGSDSGLVFLLHNQFAVWIPLHITLNILSMLDPLKSIFSFSLFPPYTYSTSSLFPAYFFVCFTFKL